MRGSRKYRFSLFALASLVAAFGAAVVTKAPPDLFYAFGWTLCGLVVAHGGTNGIEHLAEALKARGPKP